MDTIICQPIFCHKIINDILYIKNKKNDKNYVKFNLCDYEILYIINNNIVINCIKYNHIHIAKYLIEYYKFNKMDVLTFNNNGDSIFTTNIEYSNDNLLIYLIHIFKINKSDINKKMLSFSLKFNTIKYLIDEFDLAIDDLPIETIYNFYKNIKYFINKFSLVKNDILYKSNILKENILMLCCHDLNFVKYILNKFDIQRNDLLVCDIFDKNLLLHFLYINNNKGAIYLIEKYNITINEIINTEIYIFDTFIVNNNLKIIKYLINRYNLSFAELNAQAHIFRVCVTQNRKNILLYILQKYSIGKYNLLHKTDIIYYTVVYNNIEILSMLIRKYNINKKNVLSNIIKCDLLFIIIYKNKPELLLYAIDKFNLNKKNFLYITNTMFEINMSISKTILKILSFDINKIYKNNYTKLFKLIYKIY